MYPLYDIREFIEKVKDKNYLEIMMDAQREAYGAEQGTSGVKGAVKKREDGALKYADDLKGLIFFLGNGIKPFGVSDSVFHSFKPICENLVNKKQFKPEILEVFQNKAGY